MATDALAIVRRVYEAVNNSDPALFDRLDPDVRWVTPTSLPWTLEGSDGAYRGHEALATYFQNCLSHVQDLTVEVSRLTVIEDEVLALGYECGTARATGRSFRARFAQLWTVRDDKVVRLEGFPDTAEMSAAFKTQ